MSTETTLWQKILLIMSGALICLLILEIVLRVSGFIFLTLQERANQKSIRNHGEYRILCVGESTTALGGADSYPSQLERLLNTRQNIIRFSVINKGVPAINTKHILAHLNEYINNYKPQMIIAMMGINDHFDLKEGLHGWWEDFRIYKLINLIYLHVTNRIKPVVSVDYANAQRKDVPPENAQMLLYAIDMKNHGNYNMAKEVFMYLHSKKIDPLFDDRVLSELVDTLVLLQDYPNLLLALDKRLSMNIEDLSANGTIYGLCKENKGMEYIIPYLNKKISDNPMLEYYYNMLGGCYESLNQPEMSKMYLGQIEMLRNRGMNFVTRQNYLSLIDTVNRKEIKLVIMQYARRNVAPLQRMLKSVYGYDQIIWVDNQQVFVKALEKSSYDEYFSDRFAGDFGHCTAKGNFLIAENAARIILQYLIPPNKS